MRLVICDYEADLVRMIEIVAERQGHEVVGIADTAHSAERLISSARPQLVVLDPALGFGSDYDLVAVALAAGAQVVLFSRTARELPIDRYDPAPVVVDKPAIDALEDALREVVPRVMSPPEGERRRRPSRSAAGRRPLGPDDNVALFEAIGGAASGDALIWIDLTSVSDRVDLDRVQERFTAATRSGDRLLVSSTSVRGVLCGAGEEGAASFRSRVIDDAVVPPETAFHAVIVAEREHPSDAFDRLRRGVES